MRETSWLNKIYYILTRFWKLVPICVFTLLPCMNNFENKMLFSKLAIIYAKPYDTV